MAGEPAVEVEPSQVADFVEAYAGHLADELDVEEWVIEDAWHVESQKQTTIVVRSGNKTYVLVRSSRSVAQVYEVGLRTSSSATLASNVARAAKARLPR